MLEIKALRCQVNKIQVWFNKLFFSLRLLLSTITKKNKIKRGNGYKMFIFYLFDVFYFLV